MEALEAGEAEGTTEVSQEQLRHYATIALDAILQSVRRFLTNNPRNEYESIAFGAIRLIAFTFGKRVPTNVVPG